MTESKTTGSQALGAMATLILAGVFAVGTAWAQSGHQETFPWMNTALTPDERANLVLKELTLDEKIILIHGQGSPFGGTNPNAYLSNGGDGFSLGIPRLGIPPLQMIGSAYGVRFSAVNGRYSTALPSNLASTASWDPEAACEYGALIGREERAQGFNMSLAGGVDLARELRNGRNFEYHGEDPILAGTIVGQRVRCEQAQHVIGELKHYAVNDQETGRNLADAILDKRAMRETDLLAFEIGNSIGQPGAVMCAYNAVNGDYACENKYLLTDVLKKAWNFQGFVLSDWGGTHSTVKASAAGLDMEQPGDDYYGAAMKKAVLGGTISATELDDHVRRILRTEFASGIIDFPIRKGVVDAESGLAISRHLAEQSIVLLKNAHNLLPLDRAKVRSIAIIGMHADEGMISGGGSAQVDPQGSFNSPVRQKDLHKDAVWFPTSPLKAIGAMAPGAQVRFDSGADPAAAAALAKESQVVIIFAYQWTHEAHDLPNLTLPDNQDELIEKVAAANPNTIVVLETGTAATMPWADRVSGILEAWYAGSKGADAVANIIFGEVNPSAKLPITFPVSEADLPHPILVGPSPEEGAPGANMRTGVARPTFKVHYDEGLKVGYKWFDAENKTVLFPFGFGLSYTTYNYSDLEVMPDSNPGGSVTTVSFQVKNTGSRAGVEIAEVYVSLPASAGEPPKRLVGWSRVALDPGETRKVKVTVDAKFLSVFDEATNGWKLIPGVYTFRVGSSSRDLALTTTMAVH
ncbi:MAG: glycoside hydrolase family 3 C-terminal domain-containing protein [Terracidiphilus sp.]|nr:glycoside hydrolase family 3 C-terminal domain-containing protein [Terracidiphilus sp.]